jgi:hypothetical protein
MGTMSYENMEALNNATGEFWFSEMGLAILFIGFLVFVGVINWVISGIKEVFRN